MTYLRGRTDKGRSEDDKNKGEDKSVEHVRGRAEPELTGRVEKSRQRAGADEAAPLVELEGEC